MKALGRAVRRGWLLASGLVAALTGCARVPTLADLGPRELDKVERAGVEALLEQAGLRSRDLEVKERPALNRLSAWMVVEDGHVVELALAKVVDPSRLAGFRRIEELALWSGGFTDLESLHDLPALRELEIGNTPLVSAAGLAACPRLESLEIRGGRLETLAGLGDLPALRRLWAVNNRLRDLRGLAGRDGLEELNVSDNELPDLAGVAGLAGLVRLYATGNRFADPSTLPLLPRLEELALGGETFASLAGLPALPRLRSLGLRHAGLDRLDGPPVLPALERLDLSGGPLTDLAGLTWAPALEELRIEDTRVTDLGPLAGLESLRAVWAEGSPLEAVPPELAERGVDLEMDAATEIAVTQREMKRRIEANLTHFVEKLPGGSGRIWRHRGTCTWRGGLLRDAGTLRCDKRADRLTGIVFVRLAGSDPIDHTANQMRNTRFAVDLTVESGTVRAYVKTKIDYRALARTLTGRRERSGKLFELGGPERRPGEVLEGYSYAEARPGAPGRVSGKATDLAGDMVLWLEAVGGPATGIRYVVGPS